MKIQVIIECEPDLVAKLQEPNNPIFSDWTIIAEFEAVNYRRLSLYRKLRSGRVLDVREEKP